MSAWDWPNREQLAFPPMLGTRSGLFVDLYDPQPDQIALEDIVQGLSQICRFGGQTSRFLSVAYHSVMVARHVEPDVAFAGLMHDASEAYLVDVPSPVKQLLSGYQEIEERLMRAIAAKFGFNYADLARIKDVDWRACCTEARHFLSEGLKVWDWTGGTPSLPVHYQDLSPGAAATLFHGWFKRLAP